MSMYGKTHYNIVISLQVITVNEKKNCLFQLLLYNNKKKNFWKISCPARKHTLFNEFPILLLLKFYF